MTTVACVLRSGGQYDASWVGRLQRAAMKYLRPDRFVCLSDVDVPCERIPLIHDWPGWWSKCELWRPGILDGTVCYIDLDTLIVGDCTELWNFAGRFAALRDFRKPHVRASGVMLWQAGQVSIYEEALKPQSYHHFMQPNRRMDLWWNTFETAEALQDAYPGMIGSFKVDGLLKSPQDYRIVAFHGQPRPCDVRGWVAEAWAA